MLSEQDVLRTDNAMRDLYPVERAEMTEDWVPKLFWEIGHMTGPRYNRITSVLHDRHPNSTPAFDVHFEETEVSRHGTALKFSKSFDVKSVFLLNPFNDILFREESGCLAVEAIIGIWQVFRRADFHHKGEGKSTNDRRCFLVQALRGTDGIVSTGLALGDFDECSENLPQIAVFHMLRDGNP